MYILTNAVFGLYHNSEKIDTCIWESYLKKPDESTVSCSLRSVQSDTTTVISEVLFKTCFKRIQAEKMMDESNKEIETIPDTKVCTRTYEIRPRN